MPRNVPLPALRHLFTALLLVLLPPTAATASDLDKEQRWADQIVDSLIDGDASWLEVDGNRVLAIVTEPDDEPVGAAIVLHGVGAHPNWQQVVYPLRVQLAERGWLTLSLQLPILANDAEGSAYAPLFDEVAPRLDAAIAELAGMAGDDIPLVVIAHSMGSAMSSYALRGRGSEPVDAFVGIGMGGNPEYAAMDVAASLRQMQLPILDLYGELDLENVINRAGERREAGSGNPDYRQQMVPGANHFFDNMDNELVEAVAGWLETIAPR